jgi:hypothetical protein
MMTVKANNDDELRLSVAVLLVACIFSRSLNAATPVGWIQTTPDAGLTTRTAKGDDREYTLSKRCCIVRLVGDVMGFVDQLRQTSKLNKF